MASPRAARDVMVSDVGSGTVYLLADATGPLGLRGGTPSRATRLLPMLPNGRPDAARSVTLSTAIDFMGAGVSLFAGRGEIAIHDGTNLFVVNVTTGAVTGLGAFTLPSLQGCENWARWGLLERVGGVRSLVAVESATSIVRIAIPSGMVTTVGTFTDLSDMCSFSARPTLGRWYFHHEGSSQFASGLGEAIGHCNATFTTSGDDFGVTALGTDGCTVVEASPLAGDDRGGVTVTGAHVFLSGDDALARWNTDLTGGEASSTFRFDGLVSNLATGTIYSLADAMGLLGNGGGIVSRLVEHDPATGLPASTSVTLSEPIDLTSGARVGIFAGWNEMLIHDGTRVVRIELTSGTVTDLGAMPALDYYGCENWAYWGVAERGLDGQRHLVARTSGETAPTIERFLVPTGEREVIGTFTDLGDMCSLTVSPATNRWYFHHEGSSQFTPADAFPEETLGFCGAVFETM